MRKVKRLNREESQTRTRELLMRSASACFARLGFEGASVDEIAETAGFSRGAFYSNFADKDEIFLTLLKRHLERDLRDFEAALTTSDSFEQLVEKAAARYIELGDHPDWCLLMAEFQLRVSRANKTDDAFVRTYAEYRQTLSGLIEQTFAKFGNKGSAGARRSRHNSARAIAWVCAGARGIKRCNSDGADGQSDEGTVNRSREQDLVRSVGKPLQRERRGTDLPVEGRTPHQYGSSQGSTVLRRRPPRPWRPSGPPRFDCGGHVRARSQIVLFLHGRRGGFRG